MWDIDHVIPLSVFDFNDIENQEENKKLCYNWVNLRPLIKLGKEGNIAKSNKIIIDYIQKQIDDVSKYIKINTNFEYQNLSGMINWLRENTQVR